MPTLIRLIDGSFEAAEDRFTNVPDDEPTPLGDVIVSISRFQAEGEGLLADGRGVGVRVEAGETVDDAGLRPAAHRGRCTGHPEVPRRARLLVGPTVARALRLQGRGEGGRRCSARTGAVHDPLRVRRLRAGGRIGARIVGRGRERASATSISAPPMAASRFMSNATAGRPAMAYDGETAPLVTRLNNELRDAEPQAIIAAAIETLGDRLALVSSFGAELAVLLHMAAADQAGHPGAVSRHRHAVRPDAGLSAAAGRAARA